VLKEIGAAIAVSVLLHSASALTLSRGDEIARAAAVQWLQLIDAGRFEEAASQSSTDTRSFDQWRDYLTAYRTRLGRVNRRELIEMKQRPTFAGAFQVRSYYTLRFKSSFEHRPTSVEQLVLTKIGCCWEIFEYKIGDQ
jgi:hypothetical protein